LSLVVGDEVLWCLLEDELIELPSHDWSHSSANNFAVLEALLHCWQDAPDVGVEVAFAADPDLIGKKLGLDFVVAIAIELLGVVAIAWVVVGLSELSLSGVVEVVVAVWLHFGSVQLNLKV
jgi:hypothetical protein